MILKSINIKKTHLALYFPKPASGLHGINTFPDWCIPTLASCKRLSERERERRD